MLTAQVMEQTGFHQESSRLTPLRETAFLSSVSVVQWIWFHGLGAIPLIPPDNPHSAFRQDPLQLSQVKLAQAQGLPRLPAKAHPHHCPGDTAPNVDLVFCAG